MDGGAAWEIDDGGPVRTEVRGTLGVLTLAAPPVNALTAPVRGALLLALGRLAADPTVAAVALAAEGRAFSAGLDVRELDAPVEGPSLRALCEALERCPKPVLAVLEGPALGAGAELALAARWRIGTGAARMGFPDLDLGLLPGGGGTQRLPRLVGVEAALRLLLGRQPDGPGALRSLGLLDGVATGDPLAGAAAFLRGAAWHATGRPPPPDAAASLRAAARARALLRPDQAAERDLVDCVEASLLLPRALGLDFEAERHAESLARPRARALRRLFLAERRASPRLLRSTPGGWEVTAAGEALVERLGLAMGRAAGALARGGIPREEVDRALVDWGMPAGPFGGTEGGAGPAGAAALVRRVNAAVLAEGARLVAAGMASPEDVDALAVAGLGVPRASGGPVAMAEADGLAALCRDMEDWAREDPAWAVPPRLAEAAGRGTLSPAAPPSPRT